MLWWFEPDGDPLSGLENAGPIDQVLTPGVQVSPAPTPSPSMTASPMPSVTPGPGNPGVGDLTSSLAPSGESAGFWEWLVRPFTTLASSTYKSAIDEAIATPSLSFRFGTGNEVFHQLADPLMWLALALFVVCLLVFGAKLTWERRLESMSELGKGLVVMMFFSSLWAGACAGLLHVCDLMAIGFMRANSIGSKDIVEAIDAVSTSIVGGLGIGSTSASSWNSLLDYVMGIITPAGVVRGFIDFMLVFGGLSLLLFMAVRYGLLILTIAAGPLFGAAYMMGWGKEYVRKAIGWVVALAVYKPLAAALILIAIEVARGASGLQDYEGKSISALMGGLIGLTLLLAAGMSLPTLVKVIVPSAQALGTGTNLSSMAMGAAGGAAGASMTLAAGSGGFSRSSTSSPSTGSTGGTTGANPQRDASGSAGGLGGADAPADGERPAGKPGLSPQQSQVAQSSQPQTDTQPASVQGQGDQPGSSTAAQGARHVAGAGADAAVGAGRMVAGDVVGGGAQIARGGLKVGQAAGDAVESETTQARSEMDRPSGSGPRRGA